MRKISLFGGKVLRSWKTAGGARNLVFAPDGKLLACTAGLANQTAVYLFDPVHSAIGLVHSGRKGTALAIVTNAIETMKEKFETNPADTGSPVARRTRFATWRNALRYTP